MSRSGYSDDGDYDNPIIYLWDSITTRAIEGKRGQKLLRDLAVALDELPVKRLVSSSFVRSDGAVCTLGALGKARDLDMTELEKAAVVAGDDEYGDVDVAGPAGKAFGVARSMAAEIMHQNDDNPYSYREGRITETPEERWVRMRAWVEGKIEA